MPMIEDDCSTLVGQCVAILLRPDICLNPDNPADPPVVTGAVTQIGDVKPVDPNGAFLTYPGSGSCGENVSVIQKFDAETAIEQIDINGCTYWIVKTCVLPATADAAYDPDDPNSPVRALFGLQYKLTLTVNGKKCGPWVFGIDAAEDYTGVEVDGCIPITELVELDQQLPPTGTEFSDVVCATQCIMDLQAQVDAITGAVSTITDNNNGSFTHDPGDGSTPTSIAVCDLLDDLLANADTPLPDGTQLLGSDCQWYDPPSRCCLVDTTLTDPATGDPVVVVIDTDTGDTTYFDVNGQPWTGDPTTLELPGGTDANTISTVTDNDNGSFSHDPGDGTTPTTVAVCDLLDDLPMMPNTTKASSVIGMDDTGACVRIEATPVIYADATGDTWDENNANWVNPTSCPEFTELRVYNDPASGGTAIYRNLEQTVGADVGLQWHPIA